jgi:hypothetical protein
VQLLAQPKSIASSLSRPIKGTTAVNIVFHGQGLTPLGLGDEEREGVQQFSFWEIR